MKPVALHLTAVTALAVAVGIGAAPMAAAATAPRCVIGSLSAKVTGTAEGMSQPSSFITVTNTGSRTCTLRGYPTITRAWTKKGKVAIAVTNGSVQNAPQTRVRTITLRPGQHAWFALGTATAYDPPVVTVTKVAIATTRGASVADSIRVPVTQQASAPSGQPIPVGVTAFAKGVGTGD